MNIKQVPIEDVRAWQDNPWDCKTADFKRLKRQIEKLGVYKPLICCDEGGKWLCIGGNKRLLALRELGHAMVDVSIVEPKNEAEKLEYAISDNDPIGIINTQKVAELIYPHIETIELETFKISLDEPVDLKHIVEQFGPNLDGSDEKFLKYVVCPNCHYKIENPKFQKEEE